jgi:hypothetical protein
MKDVTDLAQVLLNPDWMFILCVVLETSVLVGQVPAAQEDSV